MEPAFRKLSSKNSLTLPIEWVRKLGIQNEGEVRLELVGEEIRLSKVPDSYTDLLGGSLEELVEPTLKGAACSIETNEQMEIPKESKVFLDTNAIIDFLINKDSQLTEVLRKIEVGELEGCISVLSLSLVLKVTRLFDNKEAEKYVHLFFHEFPNMTVVYPNLSIERNVATLEAEGKARDHHDASMLAAAMHVQTNYIFAGHDWPNRSGRKFIKVPDYVLKEK